MHCKKAVKKTHKKEKKELTKGRRFGII